MTNPDFGGEKKSGFSLFLEVLVFLVLIFWLKGRKAHLSFEGEAQGSEVVSLILIPQMGV